MSWIVKIDKNNIFSSLFSLFKTTEVVLEWLVFVTKIFELKEFWIVGSQQILVVLNIQLYFIFLSAKTSAGGENLCATQIAGPFIMQALHVIENRKSCFVDKCRKLMY